MKRLIVMGLCLMAAVSSYAQTGNYDWNSFSGNPSSSTGVVRDASNNPLNGATFFAQVWGGTVNNTGTFTAQSEVYSFSINTAAGASSYGQILSGQEVSPNMNTGDTMFFVINA